MNLAAPVLCALLTWWATTGLILVLVRRPPRTFRWILAVAGVLALGALAGLGVLRDQTSTAAAYAAFGCAVVVWGFLELGFLTGIITGPRHRGCAAGCHGWPHFRHAVEAILHHELSILVAAAVVFAIGWDAPNAVGTWTFAVLWLMRQSAKLNLFLGVRNPGHELLPPHLAYLDIYFRRRPINALFPFSVTVPAVIAAVIARAAFEPGATRFDVAAHLLVATLLALAVFEHWLMVLPLPVERMWAWATRGVAAAPLSTTTAKPAR